METQIPGQVIGGEAVANPEMEVGDWKTWLNPDSRKRIVYKIMETLNKHLPFSTQAGLVELRKIAARFEERIYTKATSQQDYLRKISVKMLTMETKSQSPVANSLQPNVAAGNSRNPQDQEEEKTIVCISGSGCGSSNGRIKGFNMPSSKRPRTSTPNSSESEASNPEREAVTLTDPSILDCPICFGSLSSPVHQCINGHIACSSCCTKMANKCPYCCCPTGLIRCRVLESILESVAVNCRNKMYGCTEIFKRNLKQNQLDHEMVCCYNPCYDDCSYMGIAESSFR